MINARVEARWWYFGVTKGLDKDGWERVGLICLVYRCCIGRVGEVTLIE